MPRSALAYGSDKGRITVPPPALAMLHLKAALLLIQPRRFAPRTVLAEATARAARIDPKRFRADVDAVVDPSVDG